MTRIEAEVARRRTATKAVQEKERRVQNAALDFHKSGARGQFGADGFKTITATHDGVLIGRVVWTVGYGLDRCVVLQDADLDAAIAALEYWLAPEPTAEAAVVVAGVA